MKEIKSSSGVCISVCNKMLSASEVMECMEVAFKEAQKQIPSDQKILSISHSHFKEEERFYTSCMITYQELPFEDRFM